MPDSVYGPIPDPWSISPLASLCAPVDGVQTGPFGSQLHRSDYVSDGTPIVTVEHLGDNRLLHQSIPLVSDEDVARLSKYRLRRGDIVFSRVGSVDRRALVRAEEDGWLFSGRCLRVRPDPKVIDPVYLSYFFGLETFRDHIRAIAVGATMPSINTRILSEVEVIVPPVPQQRAFAEVLGSLDDKIEANRQIAVLKTKIARANFVSWFLGSRRAPSWELRPFGELVEDNIGGDWGKEAPDETFTAQVSVIRGTDIPDIREGGPVRAPTRYIKSASLEKRRLAPGDIVIEVSGGSPTQPTGRSLLITQPLLDRFRNPVICASFCRRLRTKNMDQGLLAAAHLDYLYEIGGTWEYQYQSTGIANFQTQDFLSREMVLWPGDEMLGKFSSQCSPLVESTRESLVLSELRDALLPKLLSGELRVRGVEALVG
jgi:type I restriction enzyme S subunit